MTLIMEDLTIGYGHRRHGDRVVASHLNLSLKKGVFTCLLGPNGTGKSTLIKTLAGLLPPLAGHIHLAGKPLADYSRQQLAKNMSLVLTQRVATSHLTVRGLVAMGRYPYTDWLGRLTDQDEAAVQQAIEAVGLTELQWRPLGELSDGERQKAMIARALCQAPQLMIMDEPTAHLDLPRRVELMEMLRMLAAEQQCAILLSCHDLDLALRNGDRIWLMDQGQIHTGVPEDLVLSGAFQRAFASESLVFDPWSGAFHTPRAHRATICLQGDDLACLWTGRALTRKGYRVVEQNAHWHIHLQAGQQPLPVWRMECLQPLAAPPRHGEGVEALLQCLEAAESATEDLPCV